jgi:hypothetical protein
MMESEKTTGNGSNLARNSLLSAIGLVAVVGGFAWGKSPNTYFSPPKPPKKVLKFQEYAPPSASKDVDDGVVDQDVPASQPDCVIEDKGFGAYAPYRSIPYGKILIPKKGGHTADMGYDVFIHFHGYEPVRKSLVQTAKGVVLVGMDLGTGSDAYEHKFQAKSMFPALLDRVKHELQAYSGDNRAHIRHLALSAWSAGYGAIKRTLVIHGDQQIDAIVALDGIHSNFRIDRSVDGLTLEPTIAYAKRAIKGEKFFFITHSQVGTDTYASTTQVASYLLKTLGIPRIALDPGPGKRPMLSKAERGQFFLYGYAGSSKGAHCDQTYHIKSALSVIEQAWKTPSAEPM